MHPFAAANWFGSDVSCAASVLEAFGPVKQAHWVSADSLRYRVRPVTSSEISRGSDPQAAGFRRVSDFVFRSGGAARILLYSVAMQRETRHFERRVEETDRAATVPAPATPGEPTEDRDEFEDT